jgi:hypothetical protein
MTERKFLFVNLLFISICLNITEAHSKAVSQSVNPAGPTTLVYVSKEHDQITVKIWTHTFDIGSPNSQIPDRRTTNCTYSRYPCRLVDDMSFSVNVKDIFVPRSVFSDLSDIESSSLSGYDNNFTLSLACGDASEASVVLIEFNKMRILKRIIEMPGSHYVLQNTTYFAQPTLN